jgi:alpha-methylacyl-CoA racemase
MTDHPAASPTPADGPWRARSDGDGMVPLRGVRVVDFSVMGPGPFGSMLMASWGADVIAVVRPDAAGFPIAGAPYDVGKRRIALDLKRPEGIEVARRLAGQADVLMESFRPGVMEKLGLAPAGLMESNPSLVYVRVTGYGQSGPYARRAGHDINYLAVSGALSVMGSAEPTPPLQLLGDLASGGVSALLGILLGLRIREQTGSGTIVDTSIVDSVAQLLYSTAGRADPSVGVRLLNGTAPFYTTYECADGRRMSVGALEPHFFANLLAAMGIDEPAFLAEQHNPASWPAMRSVLAARFATKSRDEWEQILSQADVCAAPVVGLDELASNPHLSSRDVYVWGREGLRMVRAPRIEGAEPPDLEATPSATTEILSGLGLSVAEIARMRAEGIAADPA